MTNALPLMPGMPGYVSPVLADGYSLAERASVPRAGGRTARWSNTQALATDWAAYLAHNRANPIPVGKRGRTVLPPLTVLGFCAHADVSRTTYYAALKRDDDVGAMLNRIDAAMKDALISGALTRAYDGNITARLTGLAEKTEAKVHATVEAPDYDLSILTGEELDQFHKIMTKLTEAITNEDSS